ncbi:MAG: stress response translation initiation inhibitor YciH [Nanoarchaeota archaeon]
MTGEIDPITGLPKELGVFEDISKDSQSIKVYVIKRKFGKKYTIIEGLDSKDIKSKDITKSLKNKFACGGTMKEGKIELQGDYKSSIRDALVKLGFNTENIVVK